MVQGGKVKGQEGLPLLPSVVSRLWLASALGRRTANSATASL
jgi:hypothetical protein